MKILQLIIIISFCTVLISLTSCKSQNTVDQTLEKNKIGNSGIVNDIALSNNENPTSEPEIAENGDVKINYKDIKKNEENMTNSPSTPISTPKKFHEVNKLEIKDLLLGTGKIASNGASLTVNYQGSLISGEIFDSSYDRNKSFSFVLGSGQVIKGWDQGILGMRQGGKRQLIIPADLAYGDYSPSPKIPSGATLVFEVELLKVE